jgi:tRNA threonylcarbamoyladenosine biosynthesis protein TsaB
MNESGSVILALDTSADVAGVATARGDQLLASDSVPAVGEQAEKLAPLIAASMKQAGLSFSDLSGVVCAVGPGPYTGLRVGVMTAQIIASAMGLPAYGVSTHDLLAEQFAGPNESVDLPELVVVTQARRLQPSFSAYRDGRKVEGPDIAKIDQIHQSYPRAQVISTVDLAAVASSGLKWQKVSPNPSVLCEYYWRAINGLFVAGQGLIEPKPIYLRPADAREPVDLRGKALRAALHG